MYTPTLAFAAFTFLSSCATATSTEPKVVSFPITRHRNNQLRDGEPDVIDLESRPLVQRDTVSTTLVNQIPVPYGFYSTNVSVGTPPQPLSLIVDTGSSDVWVFGPGSCPSNLKSLADGLPCPGGVYDSSQSHSYQLVAANGFKIKYGTPGSYVKGDFIKETFRIGGKAVSSLQMAVATSSKDVVYGIMGIGYDQGESNADGSSQYPNLLDDLKSEGLIGSRTYSLWLNNIDDPSGNLLFGGYDSAKYEGQLKTLPIIPTMNGEYIYPAVNWTGLTATLPNGQTKSLLQSSFAGEIAILDSGTTATILPEDLYLALAQAFKVRNDASLGPIFACENGNSKGTLNYQFGGDSGPVIKVPFSQLAISILTQNGQPLRSNGIEICRFGLRPSTQTNLPALIFGDTTLSAAYVLYNWDKKEVSLAQTVFGATGSDIHDIGASTPSSSSSSSSSKPTSTSTKTPSKTTAPTKPTHTSSRKSSSSSSSSSSSTSTHKPSPSPQGVSGNSGGSGNQGGNNGNGKSGAVSFSVSPVQTLFLILAAMLLVL